MMTDPLGNPELIYYYQNPNIIAANDPVGVPLGMNSNDNGLLQWRNTFYWDRHAFPLAVTYNTCGPLSEDFTKARLTHWYHDPLTGSTLTTGREVGSTKQPLENRVWVDYPGQPNGYTGGSYDHPQDVGRILDDGSTQHSYMTYVANTNLPSSVYPPIPTTRGITYNYASNDIDVTTITNNPGSTLAAFGSYNSQHEPQTFAGADGQTWNYTYTSSGQINTIKDPNSNTTTYNYDSSNRLSTIVNANTKTVLTLTYDSDDRIQTRKDSEGYVLTYAYDNLDRITSITYPDTTTDTFDYTFQSGTYAGTPSLELRKYTDRLGRVTTYAYDADQRLTSVTEPLTSTTTRTTSYDYYEDGVPKDITDANGNVTHWDIDIQSRPIDKLYAYGTAQAQEEYYTYENTTSRLKSVKDALAQVKTYTYDLADEVTGITYTSSVNTTPNVTFTWDPNYPRITQMTDGTGTTNYSYTAVGTNGALHLSSIAGPYTNDTLGITYDALGRLSGETISGGNESFTYDAISRPTGHTTPLGSFTNTFLGQTNQITGRSVTNGSVTVSTSWGYATNTNDRRLTSITNSGVTRSYTLGYGASPVNPYDIMHITDTAATGHPWATQSHNYSYDYSDRLLGASYTTPGNFTYAYDALDNPTTWHPPSGSISPTYNDLNQISTWGTLSYTYDADGNLSSGDGVKTYKWDAENRLIEIDYVGSTAKSQFTYNGIGQRRIDVETASGGGTTTTRYMWCGEHICQTRDGSDNVLRRHLAEGEYNNSTSQQLIYMPDQIGAVRDVLDATTGNLVQSYDYDPYGGITRSYGSKATDYEYAKLFSHPNSSLNLSATRPLDSATGRWLNRDPIREAGGINAYSYVGANPINATDPLGLLVKVRTADGWLSDDIETAAQLKDVVSKLGSNSILEIAFFGHANIDKQAISDEDAADLSEDIELNGEDVVLNGKSIGYNKESLSKVLGDKLAPSAQVNLYGCLTDSHYDYRGMVANPSGSNYAPETFAQHVQKALPGTIVGGSPFYDFRLPILPTSVFGFSYNHYGP
jgi:RHS repeat-associated protein